MAASTRPQTSAAPAAPAVPTLVPQGKHRGKPVMSLTRPFTLIGSRSRAHLHLLSDTISKSHAIVVNTGRGVYVTDLASRSHVIVNGRQVREAELHDGDLLAVGSFSFKFAAGQTPLLDRPRPLPPGGLEVAGCAEPLRLEGRATVIGRRPTCDIALLEPSVSTVHAVVFDLDGKRVIRDLGSRTGTFVNGTPIHQQELKWGDAIKIGDTDFRYVAEEGADVLEELEDLVGTAPLGPEPELELTPALPIEAKPVATPMPAAEPAAGTAPRQGARQPIAPPPPQASIESPVPAPPLPALPLSVPPLPASPLPAPPLPLAASAEMAVPADDDLDPFELIPQDESASDVGSLPAPTSADASAPEPLAPESAEHDFPIEPAAPPAGAADDIPEIDLEADLDSVGSSDTVALPVPSGFVKPTPSISPQVIDEPELDAATEDPDAESQDFVPATGDFSAASAGVDAASDGSITATSDFEDSGSIVSDEAAADWLNEPVDVVAAESQSPETDLQVPPQEVHPVADAAHTEPAAQAVVADAAPTEPAAPEPQMIVPEATSPDITAPEGAAAAGSLDAPAPSDEVLHDWELALTNDVASETPAASSSATGGSWSQEQTGLSAGAASDPQPTVPPPEETGELDHLEEVDELDELDLADEVGISPEMIGIHATAVEPIEPGMTGTVDRSDDSELAPTGASSPAKSPLLGGEPADDLEWLAGDEKSPETTPPSVGAELDLGLDFIDDDAPAGLPVAPPQPVEAPAAAPVPPPAAPRPETAGKKWRLWPFGRKGDEAGAPPQPAAVAAAAPGELHLDSDTLELQTPDSAETPAGHAVQSVPNAPERPAPDVLELETSATALAPHTGDEPVDSAAPASDTSHEPPPLDLEAAGSLDDPFDAVFADLDLDAGTHEVDGRPAGQPPSAGGASPAEEHGLLAEDLLAWDIADAAPPESMTLSQVAADLPEPASPAAHDAEAAASSFSREPAAESPPAESLASVANEIDSHSLDASDLSSSAGVLGDEAALTDEHGAAAQIASSEKEPVGAAAEDGPGAADALATSASVEGALESAAESAQDRSAAPGAGDVPEDFFRELDEDPLEQAAETTFAGESGLPSAGEEPEAHDWAATGAPEPIGDASVTDSRGAAQPPGETAVGSAPADAVSTPPEPPAINIASADGIAEQPADVGGAQTAPPDAEETPASAGSGSSVADSPLITPWTHRAHEGEIVSPHLSLDTEEHIEFDLPADSVVPRPDFPALEAPPDESPAHAVESASEPAAAAESGEGLEPAGISPEPVDHDAESASQSAESIGLPAESQMPLDAGAVDVPDDSFAMAGGGLSDASDSIWTPAIETSPTIAANVGAVPEVDDSTAHLTATPGAAQWIEAAPAILPTEPAISVIEVPPSLALNEHDARLSDVEPLAQSHDVAPDAAPPDTWPDSQPEVAAENDVIASIAPGREETSTDEWLAAGTSGVAEQPAAAEQAAAIEQTGAAEELTAAEQPTSVEQPIAVEQLADAAESTAAPISASEVGAETFAPGSADPFQPLPAHPPAPQSDPFFGMVRDQASFIGGLPLSLPPLPPPAPAPRRLPFGQVPVTFDLVPNSLPDLGPLTYSGSGSGASQESLGVSGAQTAVPSADADAEEFAGLTDAFGAADALTKGASSPLTQPEADQWQPLENVETPDAFHRVEQSDNHLGQLDDDLEELDELEPLDDLEPLDEGVPEEPPERPLPAGAVPTLAPDEPSLSTEEAAIAARDLDEARSLWDMPAESAPPPQDALDSDAEESTPAVPSDEVIDALDESFASGATEAVEEFAAPQPPANRVDSDQTPLSLDDEADRPLPDWDPPAHTAPEEYPAGTAELGQAPPETSNLAEAGPPLGAEEFAPAAVQPAQESGYAEAAPFGASLAGGSLLGELPAGTSGETDEPFRAEVPLGDAVEAPSSPEAPSQVPQPAPRRPGQSPASRSRGLASAPPAALKQRRSSGAAEAFKRPFGAAAGAADPLSGAFGQASALGAAGAAADLTFGGTGATPIIPDLDAPGARPAARPPQATRTGAKAPGRSPANGPSAKAVPAKSPGSANTPAAKRPDGSNGSGKNGPTPASITAKGGPGALHTGAAATPGVSKSAPAGAVPARKKPLGGTPGARPGGPVRRSPPAVRPTAGATQAAAPGAPTTVAGYIPPPAFGAPVMAPEAIAVRPAIPSVAAPAGSRRLRWVLLVLVLLCAAATAAAGYFFLFRPHGAAAGVLHFRGLDKLSDPDRQAFRQRQIAALRQADSRIAARTSVLQAGVQPGFLGEAPSDVRAYEGFVQSVNWTPAGDALTLKHEGLDPAGDKQRVRALLQVLYARNQAEWASQNFEAVRADREKALQAARQKADELATLDVRIQEATAKARQEPLLRDLADRLKQKSDALAKDRDAAHAAVVAIEQELEQIRTEAAAAKVDLAALLAVIPTTQPTTQKAPQPSASTTKPANGVGVAAGGPATAQAAVPTEDDSELKQLAADMKRLVDGLGAAKESREAQVTQAKAAFDRAQMQFDMQVKAAEVAVGDGTGLGKYVKDLKDVQEGIRKLNDEMVQQQKDERDRLDSLKNRMLALDADRVKQVWSEDDGLRVLQQQLSVAEHRYNTAAGARLPEAAGLKAQMKDIAKLVEARRGLLASKDLYTPQNKALQDYIDDSLRRMEQDRLKNESRLQSLFKQATAPDVDSLPDSQKVLARRMEDAKAALSKARADYNDKSEQANARADAMVKLLTVQVTAQQAKIDDRHKQLAAAVPAGAAADGQMPAQGALSPPGAWTGKAELVRRRNVDLEVASRTEAAATAAYAAAYHEFETADRDATAAGEAAVQVAAAREAQAPLLREKADQEARADVLGKKLATAVEAVRPGEDAVTVTRGPDRRPYFLAMVGFAAAGLMLVTFLATDNRLALAEAPQPQRGFDLTEGENPAGGADAGDEAIPEPLEVPNRRRRARPLAPAEASVAL